MNTGAVGTQEINSSQRVVDMVDKLFLLEPQAAPLYVLVSKLNKAPAHSTTIYWLEDALNPSWATVTATASASLTGITVVTGEGLYFNKYDLVKIPSTGEVILVTATEASGITAVRGYGSTAAANIASAASLVIIGSAFEEGSANTTLVTKSTVSSTKTNYLQIFRKSVEITKTLAASDLYGGPDRPYQRKKKGIELMRDLERAFLFGEPYEDTGSKDTTISYARRVTGGVGYWISTNATAAGGVLTESEFEGFLRSVFRYGSSNSRYLFCSPLIISVISQWAQGKLVTYSKDKTYGINITQYLSPHGTVNLVKDVLLENAGSISNTSYYAGYAFALDLPELKYRYLQGRDVQLETDIQHPGDDLYKDQYICEVGMELHQEKQHGELTGVTG